MKYTDIKKIWIAILLLYIYILPIICQERRQDSLTIQRSPIHTETPTVYSPIPEWEFNLSRPEIIKGKPILEEAPVIYRMPSVPALSISSYHLFFSNAVDPNAILFRTDNNSPHALYLYGRVEEIPGIAIVNSATVGIILQPTEYWNMNVGGSAYRFRNLKGLYNDFTINASTHIEISDIIGLNIFGSYSTNARLNAHPGELKYSPFAPTTHYGGSIQYQKSNKFSLETGIKRELNVWTNEWESIIFIRSNF
ncbi:hypothetical protein [Limibacterium fermenti]|uniref:hypothetical protein n=1 Tax=Limibacterium fermenti TaxID=3229863 RepID=UPI003A751399